jgi:hypothetical protein
MIQDNVEFNYYITIDIIYINNMLLLYIVN